MMRMVLSFSIEENKERDIKKEESERVNEFLFI
jgi:hypothetical protein